MAECYYRVYVCGSYCGVEAEDDADCDADSYGEDDAFEGNNREHAGEICDHPRNEHAQSYAHQAADGGENYGLYEELADDLPSLGADGATDTYFACALGDRGQHDVHNAYASDKQADCRDRA